MKEKLKQLLEKCCEEFVKNQNEYYWLDFGADYLIKNGVVVLPCKVGTTVYEVAKVRGEDLEYQWTVVTRKFNLSMYDGFGKTVFLTREEAQNAWQEFYREDIREMLEIEGKF